MTLGTAVMLADGGDALCDQGALRDQPVLFGAIACDIANIPRRSFGKASGEHQVQIALLVGDGLPAAIDVDDAQAAHPEPNAISTTRSKCAIPQIPHMAGSVPQAAYEEGMATCRASAVHTQDPRCRRQRYRRCPYRLPRELGPPSSSP